jgi:RNA polymerase sigma-70 factor, ECF subfamily
MTVAEELLVGVHRGDEQAIEELVVSHQNGIYSYALSMVRDSRDAEEVAQDTFIRAVRAVRTQYSDEQIETLQIRPWLLRIARNLALNRLRARKSRPVTDPLDGGHQIADPSSYGESELDSGDERLHRGLEQLDWSVREWLELRFVQDLSYAEIATVKGGSEAAARGKVFRAIASLRQLCSEDESVEV